MGATACLGENTAAVGWRCGGDPADPKTGPSLPEYQQSLGQRLVTEGVTKETALNHVLVNLYKPGQGTGSSRRPSLSQHCCYREPGAPCIMSFYSVRQNETEAPSAPRIGLVFQPRPPCLSWGGHDSYLHSIARRNEKWWEVGGPIVNAAEAGVLTAT